MNYMTKTNIGLVRETNQDSCCAGALDDSSVYSVVCDGMGGVAGGAVASNIAVNQIRDKLTDLYSPSVNDIFLKRIIESAVNAANTAVFEAAKEKSELEGMGTTVVVALVRDKTAYIVHAGDSRAYLLSENKIELLTHDHSVVQQMVDNGKITVAEARLHPQRNIITRALGVSEEVDTDYCEYPLSPGDCLLICTDGLTNCVTDDEIMQIFSQGEIDSLADRLLQRALSNGGTDNVTVALLY